MNVLQLFINRKRFLSCPSVKQSFYWPTLSINYILSPEKRGPVSVRNRQHLRASVTMFKRELRRQNCPQTIDKESLPSLSLSPMCIACTRKHHKCFIYSHSVKQKKYKIYKHIRRHGKWWFHHCLRAVGVLLACVLWAKWETHAQCDF